MPAPLTAPYSRGLRIAEADDHSPITYNVMARCANPIAAREAPRRWWRVLADHGRRRRQWRSRRGGEAMRIGFVGTGTMGTPIAGCLIAAGHELIVHDVRPQAMAALAAQGAALAETAAAVARDSEAVFTSLPGPKEVEEAVFAPRMGLRAGWRRERAYVDGPTNWRGVARGRAGACRGRGVRFLDAPVGGRPPAMTVMAGGAAEDFARLRPLFEAIARNVFHVGK